MPEWLGLEWWRYAWGPALAAGLVWLASTWKTTGDTRGARDARLDTRQEKELARLDAEADDLRMDRDRGWNLARHWWNRCHDLRHLANNKIHALGGSSEDRMPDVPPLEEPLSKPRV